MNQATQTIEKITREIKLAKQQSKLNNVQIAEATGITSATVNAILHAKPGNIRNYLKVLHLFGGEIEVKMPEITPRLKTQILSEKGIMTPKQKAKALKANE